MMSKITIFSAPKPFTDPHISIIQRNAIQSWIQLGKDVEVVLVGEEAGLAEVAEEYNAIHKRGIKKNEFGTPRVDSIFHQARISSNNEVLAYVNADIILTPDFIRVTKEINNLEDYFLIVGRRWDIRINAPLPFQGNWLGFLEQEIRQKGKLHGPTAIDYFIFPRFSYVDIPAFAIGRAGWDNWMVYQAKKKGMMVIDGSCSITAIHQNHDYSHLPGGRTHHDLEESSRNVKYGGGFSNMFDLLDADYYFIDNNKRVPALDLPRMLRMIERAIMPQEKKGLRWILTRRIRQMRKKAVKRQTDLLQNRIIKYKFTSLK
jgi:hypothetical protein